MKTVNSFALLSYAAILLQPWTPSESQVVKVSRSNRVQLLGTRIIGGDVASAADAPYQLQVRIINSVFLCGAALSLSPATRRQIVITAAHCVTYPGRTTAVPPEILEVRAGSIKMDEQTQTLGVHKIMVHPDYTIRTKEGVPQHDIAILYLKEDFDLGATVKPIPLPSPDQAITGGVKLSGWGSTGMSTIGEIVEDLRVVELPLVDSAVCSTWYTNGESDDVIYDTTFCAGFEEEEKGGCQGDSGGPGVGSEGEETYLAGVASWGDNRCQSQKHPTVFTRVSSYVDWIKEVATRVEAKPRAG